MMKQKETGTKVRYAAVGAGWITQEAFLPAVPITGNSVVTALITGDVKKAQVLQERYRIPHVYHYDEYQKFLEADVADAVYLALPNDMHHQFSMATLQQGLHLLLEKPMALNEAECLDIIKAAEESAAKLMIAYRLHYDPATLATIVAVRGGKIGEPRFFHGWFSQHIAAQNHRANAKHWAGPLPDLGIYPLNAARKVFNAEPIEAMAMHSTRRTDKDVKSIDETVAVLLRFPDNRIAQFTLNYGATGANGYRIVGTKGEIELIPGFAYDKAMEQKLTLNGETKKHLFPETNQFAGEVQYFSDCILNNTTPLSDGWEGLADVRILKAIEHSYHNGRAVPLQPIAQRRSLDPELARSLTPVIKGELVNASTPDQG